MIIVPHLINYAHIIAQRWQLWCSHGNNKSCQSATVFPKLEGQRIVVQQLPGFSDRGRPFLPGATSCGFPVSFPPMCDSYAMSCDGSWRWQYFHFGLMSMLTSNQCWSTATRLAVMPGCLFCTLYNRQLNAHNCGIEHSASPNTKLTITHIINAYIVFNCMLLQIQQRN